MGNKEEFTASFREVQPKFPRLCARLLGESSLTLPQFALLNLVADAGTIPMTEVSEKLHITKPAVTNLVDRLEKNKFLKRIPHPHDRRVYLIQILPKGEKTFRGMQEIVLKPLLKAFDRMNETEKKAVSKFYKVLSQAMELELENTENK